MVGLETGVHGHYLLILDNRWLSSLETCNCVGFAPEFMFCAAESTKSVPFIINSTSGGGHHALGRALPHISSNRLQKVTGAEVLCCQVHSK
jgi:hypothetical protein